jgi:hypothetical protein
MEFKFKDSDPTHREINVSLRDTPGNLSCGKGPTLLPKRPGSSLAGGNEPDNREEENLVMPFLFGGARLEEIYESAISKQPGMIEWRIQEPLQGDLDLTFLGENSPIQVLEFAPGEGDRVITELRGLPRHLTKLTCTHQKLRELRDLPNTLLELNVSHNRLSTLDFSDVPRLKVFRGSHNTLYRLDNLPATLEEMYVDHNKLSTLNLLGLSYLRVLHARYNPHPLILKNVPSKQETKTAIDIQLDDDPFRQLGSGANSSGANGSDSESDSEGESESDTANNTKKKSTKSKKIPYTEALNHYFAYKTKYELSVKKMAEKAAKVAKGAKSSKTTKKTAKKLPECIQCRANVGMTFSKKKQTYHAHCGIGNQRNCPFEIELYTGEYDTLDTLIREQHTHFEHEKQELLQQKMETLFGWIDEKTSSMKFKERLEEYMGNNIYNDRLVNLYQELHFSKNRQDMEDRQLQKIAEIKAQIHAILNEYHAEPLNKELLRDALEVQVKELIPEIAQLRTLKYPIMEMNPVEEMVEGFMGREVLAITGYKLFQRTNPLNTVDFEISPPKVVKYHLNSSA